jgi:uncharacterized RDD family membrane protein YckC
MDWCRACGGRLTAEDRLCPWCRAPTAARPRERAGERDRDRLPDPAPYSLDEAEHELPSFDETPAVAPREHGSPERAPRATARSDAAVEPHAPRSPPPPPNGIATSSGPQSTARRPEPSSDRRDGPWRLDDPPPPARDEAASAATRAAAPFVPRALAFIVDLVILGLLDGVLFVATIAAVGVAGLLRNGAVPDPGDVIEALFTAGQIGLFFGYFGLLHTGGGQTLGKALVGIRVVRSDGRDLTLVPSLLRAGAYAFSALPLGIGFLLAAMPPGRALHDYLIGSRVVQVGGS